MNFALKPYSISDSCTVSIQINAGSYNLIFKANVMRKLMIGITLVTTVLMS